MSDLVFNDEVSASWAFEYLPKTVFNNVNVRSVLGTRQSFRNSDHDKKIYTLNFLNLNNTEKLSLEEFFEDRYGSNESFLFQDDRLYQAISETIGTGDASTVTFQLTEDGFDRWNIQSGSYTIWAGVTEQTEGGGNDYTLDITNDGRIIFNSAPTTGASIVATFNFYRRVHFLNDDFPARETTYYRWQVDNLILEEEIINVS